MTILDRLSRRLGAFPVELPAALLAALVRARDHQLETCQLIALSFKEVNEAYDVLKDAEKKAKAGAVRAA